MQEHKPPLSSFWLNLQDTEVCIPRASLKGPSCPRGYKAENPNNSHSEVARDTPPSPNISLDLTKAYGHTDLFHPKAKIKTHHTFVF